MATATLMGKCKLGEWERIDAIDTTSSSSTEQEQKTHIENEWKQACGQSWMFKWVEEEIIVSK